MTTLDSLNQTCFHTIARQCLYALTQTLSDIKLCAKQASMGETL